VGPVIELLELLASPWNLLWALVGFGFAPGFCLRLIVMLYPSEHPRRRELVAELYTMKRAERPLFVAEQLETALFEGLGARFKLQSRKERDQALVEQLALLINDGRVIDIRIVKKKRVELELEDGFVEICTQDQLDRVIEMNLESRGH
jgi:hypothetical protein